MNSLFGLRRNAEGVERAGGEDIKLAVDLNRCPQNHPCPAVRVCPVGALSQRGFEAPEVDMDKCIRCGKCVKFCPMRALSLR